MYKMRSNFSRGRHKKAYMPSGKCTGKRKGTTPTNLSGEYIMNQYKILGNALVAFGTSFVAASWVGGINSLGVALMNALIFAIIAAGKELQDESCKKRPVLSKILDKAVLF